MGVGVGVQKDLQSMQHICIGILYTKSEHRSAFFCQVKTLTEKAKRCSD